MKRKRSSLVDWLNLSTKNENHKNKIEEPFPLPQEEEQPNLTKRTSRSLLLTKKEEDIIENSKSSILTTTRRSKRLLQLHNEIVKKPKSLPIHKCPFIEFKGEIKYCTNVEDINAACEILLNNIEEKVKVVIEQEKDIIAEMVEIPQKSNESNDANENDKTNKTQNKAQKQREDAYNALIENLKKIPIAFDMEWPFNFKTGPERSSVIQLCAEETISYVFSVGNLKDLPINLLKLLNHSNVCLHGVNIKNDCRKLQRDFPEVDSNFLIEKCIDLGLWYNLVKNRTGRWSLERLVNTLLRLQIDKSIKIRMSKWNVVPLEEHQLRYAAIDVYIGQMLYKKIKSVSDQILLKNNEMKNEMKELSEKSNDEIENLNEDDSEISN